MRAVIAVGVLGLGLGLAACSPEIVPGAYLCGPEEACPDGLACDRVEDVCVLPTAVRPFACGATSEGEPNDAPEAAHRLDLDACVTPLLELRGCAESVDTEDWFELAAPANCTAVAARVRLAFPGAYEEVGVEIHGAEPGVLATAERCTNDVADDADELRCLEYTLTPGERYTLRVHRTGEGSCDGECAFNRYLLSVQLLKP